MIGIGIEDELRVGQVLLQNKRIHGIDDHVIASVDHQRRVGNLSEIVERARAGSAPLADRGDLRRCDLLAHLRVATLLAQAKPLQKRPASSLARLGRCEESSKPRLVRVCIGRAEHGLSLGGQGRHALATSRPCPHQDQAADQARLGERQRLRDEAAKRKTEDVDLCKTKRLDERRRVGRHLLDRGWHLAVRAGNARVIEQDHLPPRREAVGHQRVPVVHGTGEMHVEDERDAARFAEAPVSEPNTCRLYELRRRGLVAMNHF